MKSREQDTLEKLAQELAARVREAGGARLKPVLSEQSQQSQPRLFDDVTRDSCLRRILFLRRAYRLHWLVDQETFDQPGLGSLEDAQIAALLKAMERARECIADGVAFEDAGLLRDTSLQVPVTR